MKIEGAPSSVFASAFALAKVASFFQERPKAQCCAQPWRFPGGLARASCGPAPVARGHFKGSLMRPAGAPHEALRCSM